jgi:arsenate reductase
MLHAGAIFDDERLLLRIESAVGRGNLYGQRALPNHQYKVLFLCTGNSARSIMAECAINRWGREKFRGFSAGSHPKGAVHPLTLELLSELNYETTNLRSKSWDEFAAPDSPHLDFIFTVCDQAAAEQCPFWPGQPITAHWGVADPAAFKGSDEEKRRFFYRIYLELENRIKIFASLKIEVLDSFALQQRIAEIGRVKLPEDREQ